MINKSKRTWVEINQKNLVSNFKTLSKVSGKTPKKMVVVKSNAYGHGIVECAKVLEKAGADFLAVDSFDEAVLLRRNKLEKPLLVLGFTHKNNFKEASQKNISLTISNSQSLKDLAALNCKIKVHIKADTGLHRQGFMEDEMIDVKKVLIKNKKIVFEGLYTHLAGAESNKFLVYTKKQISGLNKWIDELSEINPDVLTHCAASAAAIIYPDSRFKMVRFGIALYGLWPSEETRLHAQEVNLKPVLKWNAIISEVKAVKKGEPCGYDCSETLSRDSIIGIVPVGYWHGYPRIASTKSFVLVKGQRAKVLGKVSMDMIIVDLTKVRNPKQGDVATLIGKDVKDEVSVEEIAGYCETINYEIVTRINPEITRVFK
jgi:alanine racemase